MRIPIIITTLRIIEGNLEVEDHIEVKILVDLLSVRIPVVEANRTKAHIKANIKATIIKVLITKVIMVSIIIHTKVIIRVIIVANLEGETMVVVEEITMDTATAGPIIEVIIITNTISIIVMMVTASLSNMAHYAHYAMATATPPNIALRKNMILTI